MKELHDRIARIIDEPEFEAALEEHGTDLATFQCAWAKASKGDFSSLSAEYQTSIIQAETEIRERTLGRLQIA
jgi:hypothetical protein